jgi:hypothetical protein
MAHDGNGSEVLATCITYHRFGPPHRFVERSQMM